MRTTLSVALGLAVIWAWGVAEKADAQVRSSTTSRSGLFGTRTVGGTLSAGTRTIGAGTGRTGQAVAGATTQGSASPLGTTSGQLSPSARFVRGARQPGEFVGAGSEDLAGFIGAVQAGATQTGRAAVATLGSQARGTRTSTQGRSTTGRSTSGRAAATELRTPVQMDFEFPARSTATAAAAIQTRLNQILAAETLPAIRVELSGETARLSGMVATARERQLAERLVLLEPGIWEVSNELIVAESAAPRDRGTAGPSAPPAGPPSPAGVARPEAQNPSVEEQGLPPSAPATPDASAVPAPLPVAP